MTQINSTTDTETLIPRTGTQLRVPMIRAVIRRVARAFAFRTA